MANPNYLSTKGKSRRGKPVQPEKPMKPVYDFSIAEHGKFYRAEAEFRFPIYLAPDVDEFVNNLAEERKMEVQELVNHLLRADKEIIQGT